jgi:hypothetical protein
VVFRSALIFRPGWTRLTAMADDECVYGGCEDEYRGVVRGAEVYTEWTSHEPPGAGRW